MTNRLTKNCPDCGNLCDRRSKRCQDCAKQARKVNAVGQHDRCMDCGTLTGDNAHRAKRCWECWLKVKRSRPKRLCSVPSCSKVHRAKGFCSDHYAGTRMARDTNTGEPLPWNRSARAFAASLPCQVCGYNRMRSHIHRLERLKGYTWGNVMALCARCHDEIHSGLTPPPPALKLE